jgi:lysophospholipase L1-like esterase
MTLRIRDNETILFIGDSITDCGRRGSEQPLGNGYVKLFADLAAIREPAKCITIINKGIGGDIVTGLQSRWTDDVLRHKPDWLSILIGINDLHCTLGQAPNAVPPARYRAAYDDILARTRARLPRCRILLMDPFYISLETSSRSFRRQVLDLIPKYIRVVRAMSRTYHARHVATHALFQNLLKHHEADVFCPEPVHPNLAGHLAMAEAVYAALSQ